MPNTSNEQLWLRQLRWKELAQDPCWDPLTFSPEGVHWEKQGSLWVPSDTAALENYAGYIVSCSTWEAEFTHLFNEITTHYFICNMHNEMTSGTKTEISPSSLALTIPRGQGGSHTLSAVREGPDKQ